MKFLSILIIIGLIYPLTSQAFVISNPLKGAFGGKILSVQYCTCSFNLLLYIGPPRGGSFILGPGSIIYLFYQVYRSSPWVLGTSSGNAPCMQYSGNSCVKTGSGSIIKKIGTSLW